MGKKFVTKENLDDNLKEYTKEVVKPLINNDSYLSRAKKLNTDNDFTEESNFIYGIDNIAGGGEELKQANLNFSLMSIYSFSSKLDIEDTDESRENCRKLILENIEEVFSKNNLLDEPKTLSQTNGWFFDKTDMNFQKGTKSPSSFYITFHKYTPITIKNATIIGKGLKSTNDGNVVLGQYNKTTDAAFVIGNGTASDNSDAVVITNTGDLHVSNIYIKDNLFNPDYSEVDANKSSYILNKPIFTDGLLSENCLDESVSIVEGSNKDITITLSQDNSKYSKILFTQVFNANDANSCGVSDLLKTDIGTTIFSTSSGYGLMNITLDKIEGNTIQISYDTNYFSSKVTTFFTIDAYLNYVKINVNSTEDKTFGYNPSKNEWQEIEEPTTKISNEPDNALIEKEDGLFVQQSEVEPVTEWSETISDENIPSEKLVKDTIDSGKLTTTTWSELKELRDNKKLSPGTVYRITDYVCTTVQANTRAKNNLFDILVTALDKETLNENASAIYHEGDTYFTKEALPIWKLKYCLDNDTTRFAWADADNGKGVIWYMKDEYNNECAYDFKNIQFLRDAAFNTNYSEGVPHYYLTAADYYYYTFTVINGSNLYDMSCMSTVKAAGITWTCIGNKVLGFSSSTASNIRELTLNVFCGNVTGTDNEHSVCYNKVDGYKNTLGGRNVNNNNFESDVVNNFFADEGYCYHNNLFILTNNVFKSICYDNKGDTKVDNNVFIGNCAGNNFRCQFENNVCKGNFIFNDIGSNCKNNTFNNNCVRNTIGYDFLNNVVDCYFRNNTIGNNIQYVHFSSDDNTKQVNNYYIASGLQGTSTTKLEVIPVPGRTTEYTISKTSDGTVVDYCVADLSTQIGQPLIAKSDEEMAALMVESNAGKVIRFIGNSSSTYENNGIYIVEIE